MTVSDEAPGVFRWRLRGLWLALVLSLAFHLALFTTIEIGGRLGWWRHSFIRNWLVTPLTARQASAVLQERARAEAARQQDTPLLFLEVDPTKAAADAPEKALYYAANNSKAANPDVSKTTATPRIEGTQDKVPRTTTLTKPSPQPTVEPRLEAPPIPQPLSLPQPKPIAAAKPLQPSPQRTEIPTPSETALRPGDVLIAKPAPEARSSQGQADSKTGESSPPQHERPRTIAQAKAKTADAMGGAIIGEKMKQEGGVQRFGVESSLDARATSYGAYDAAVIAAIQQRWYALLDERGFSMERSGKVVIDFRMKHDGSIHDLKVNEADVGEIYSLVCQRAIVDPAPFGEWPRQMRLELGDRRSVRFTFHYN